MTTPPDPPQADRLPAAQRIRETASALFLRHGSRAVGVDEIVATAGATKPSLYRAFGSKDQLIAAWIEDQAALMWAGLEAAESAAPSDPRAQILAYIDGLVAQSEAKAARGCALSNTVVEYPRSDHPGRLAAVDHKERLRKRLREQARAMNARKPKKLADSLLLLIEGIFITRQIYGTGGPAGAARGAVEALLAAHTRERAEDGETPAD